MAKHSVEIGQQYGRLTVMEPRPAHPKHGAMWLCKCQCGAESVTAAYSLRAGRTKSCGCLRDEVRRANGLRNVRHGHARTSTQGKTSRTYAAWRSMVQRCTIPSHPSFRYYGAAGVAVCERWSSFDAFLADMGERPEGCTIDRIDNARGYQPGNCRWATQREQQNNRTNNARVTAFGRTQTISEWAAEVGMDKRRLRDRLVRRQLPPEEALRVTEGRT